MIKEDGRSRASRTCHIPRARTTYSRQRNAFLGESNVSENLRTSSSENDIYAGAFQCAFTIYLERKVAFPNEIIVSMRSEGKVT